MLLEPVHLAGIFTAGVFVAGAVKVIRSGGIRGAMFGAPVHDSYDDITGMKQGPATPAARVHVCEGRVGLEIVVRSFACRQATPIGLSPENARRLAALLNEAAERVS